MSNRECDENLIRKYYQNKCSAEEKRFVEQCFVDINYARKIKDGARQEWEEISAEGDKKGLLTDILCKIHYNIRVEEFRKLKERRWISATKSTLLRVSAALLIPLLLFNIWQWQEQNRFSDSKTIFTEIHAPYGSRIQFNLPDGSSGWLNSGSSLKFPIEFASNERKVILNGEGYFNVIRDPKKTFIVTTKYYQVRALGTSFNVMSYSDLDAIEEVTLESGKVRIEKKMQDGSFKKVLDLKPGQHALMDHTSNSIEITDNEFEKYTAWKEGKLIFRNDPLERVIRNLERNFNIEIEVEDEQLFKYHFFATFEEETLFETLRLLKLSSAIDYKILAREKNQDGSFKKRKIILFQKTKH
ncbi:MAG: FecR domain-containing protein [Bacteroidota bacterium]